MTQEQVDLLFGAIELVCLIVCFLKGRWTVIILAIGAALLSPVAIFGTYWHHIITEPLGWWPLVAIFRLAKPSSRWADWFYNEPKIQLARARYPTANPVPRSLQKQAVRSLKAIDRGDLSAIQQRLGEQKATTEPPEQAVTTGIFATAAQQQQQPIQADLIVAKALVEKNRQTAAQRRQHRRNPRPYRSRQLGRLLHDLALEPLSLIRCSSSCCAHWPWPFAQ